MSFQDRLCEAFCAEVRVSPFSGGYGVSTPFEDEAGDLLGFYVLGPDQTGRFKIVDNALTVARFEADGAVLDSETRLSAFNEIIVGYGATYDDGDGDISISNVAEETLARKSLDFMAMLLRLQDMYLLTQERTKSTFLDDVDSWLAALNVDGLMIEKDAPISDALTDVVPDYVLSKEGVEKPVALFVVSQNEKLWQAMYLKSLAEHEARVPVSVIALLQSDKTGTSQIRAKADNRLDAVPKWEGDEAAALGRILRPLDVPQSAIIH